MELLRDPLIYHLGRIFTTIISGIYYNIEFSGEKNIPITGPALLLPKHQSYFDIPIEGTLLSNCHRAGNWVMKYSLPDILNHLGGIKVVRSSDIINEKDCGKRRELINIARELNPQSLDYVKWLFNQGEIVVIHPEGTRKPGQMNCIRKEIFDIVKDAEHQYDLKIPIIPVGIEYESLGSFRSKVYIRAGEQLDVYVPDIVDIVKDEIKKLSNL